MNNQLLSLKAKKFGVRLAAFRQTKGIPIETLSKWTGLPVDEIERIELGQSTLSLPEIELIAHKLGLMTETLLSSDLANLDLAEAQAEANKQFAVLRNRMIALVLRKTRSELDKSADQISVLCGVSQAELEAYESGNVPIPWPVLECLCAEYQIPMSSLVSQITSAPKQSTKETPIVSALPEIGDEMQDFVQNPSNKPYLELAKKLSEMDAEKLRNIAEGLLEITY